MDAVTATHVDGVPVIHTEPAESPLSTSVKPVFFKQIVKLLLEDGTEMFGCLHCDFTRTAPLPIRSHLKAHAARYKKGDHPQKSAEMSLTDLLARVAEMDKVTAERDEWKRRAREAERKLASLRQALAP
ncbi:hypothetical protein [Actinomadura litoris]|uniref:hypothetical protein n=1 Tax=Actinomadura litoris TaxID=2678616 RepID=UPI001FA77459|nr:hypothetical protein [Actinomadura litoris]